MESRNGFKFYSLFAFVAMMLSALGAATRCAADERQSIIEAEPQDTLSPNTGQERGRMIGPRVPPTGPLARSIQVLFRDMTVAAARGDIDQYLDLLSDKDQRRLRSIRNDPVLLDLSKKLDEIWQRRFGSAVEADVNPEALPVIVSDSTGDDRVTAQFRTLGAELAFQIVSGGWFGHRWRVDVPTSVDAIALRTNLREALISLEQEPLPVDRNQAVQELAFRLLKPVSSSSNEGITP